MKRALEPRVEKLERAAGIGEHGGVWFVDFVGVRNQRPVLEELIGVRFADRLIERPKAESEEDFIDRIQTELHRPGAWTVLIAERKCADEPT